MEKNISTVVEPVSLNRQIFHPYSCSVRAICGMRLRSNGVVQCFMWCVLMRPKYKTRCRIKRETSVLFLQIRVSSGGRPLYRPLVNCTITRLICSAAVLCRVNMRVEATKRRHCKRKSRATGGGISANATRRRLASMSNFFRLNGRHHRLQYIQVSGITVNR